MELDNEIAKIYNETEQDILEIAKLLNIPIYRIISALVREKVIKTRSQARGYSIYIETDEYKNKLNQKKDDEECSLDSSI